MTASCIPLISVVSINRNNEAGLNKTISSVISQTCKEFEYIVIDGASTDGSVETIRRFANSIDYWISEPDKGIYNAMNKALQHCHGEYVLFMNSGDCFSDNEVVACLTQMRLSADFVIGRICSKFRFFSVKSFTLPKVFNFYTFYRYNMPHQATLTRLSVLRELGGYDESLRICADWSAAFLLVMQQQKTITCIQTLIATIDTTGVSSFNGQEIASEKATVFQHHFPDEYHLCKEKRRRERFSLVSIQLFLVYKITLVLRRIGLA